MSKIICDVCGTSYPETATQCPICGCVRAADANVVSGDTNEPQAQTETTYTYVKGGRFSKANVKKRNSAAQGASADPVVTSGDDKKPSSGSEKGLLIVVIALLLAIIAVVLYIVLHFFGPGANSNTGVLDEPTDTTAATTQADIPCTEINVEQSALIFDSAEQTVTLSISVAPDNTTDKVEYLSTDETIATVSPTGVVTPVAPGEAVIKVTCGQIVAEITVSCTFVVEPTTEPTTAPQYSTDDFKFRKTDISMGQKGQRYTLYKGQIPVEEITWTTDNDKIATVENGIVTAVGKGTTRVYGEYAGVKLECIVRCKSAVGAYTGEN